MIINTTRGPHLDLLFERRVLYIFPLHKLHFIQCGLSIPFGPECLCAGDVVALSEGFEGLDDHFNICLDKGSA